MVVGKIQIYSIGPQDFYLTGNPQITFFKSVFRRHTRFARHIQRVFFNGTDPTFGSKDNKIKLKKNGDLLGEIFVRADITATSDEAGSYTINHFGNSLIKKVEILIGNYLIDRHHSPWFQIYDEIYNEDYSNTHSENVSSNKGGKSTNFNFLADVKETNFTDMQRQNGDTPLVFGGGTRNNSLLSAAGTYTKRIYIPLKFWFNKRPGMYLPLTALYKHEVELNFDIEELTALIGNNTNLSSMSLDFQVYATYYNLDDEEKRKFSQANHEYVIEQLQMNDGTTGRLTLTSNNEEGTEISEERIDLNLQHPVKYLTWVIVNEGTKGNNPGQGPCYFSSLVNNSLYGNDGNNGSIDLYVGGVEREINLSMAYFTRYQHSLYSKNIPSLDRVGMYSFALNPLDYEPSGSCNFSRIKDNFINVKFANNNLDTIKGKKLYIFAVNYNVLMITDGMAMLRYT